jgi:hypothetical protein
MSMDEEKSTDDTPEPLGVITALGKLTRETLLRPEGLAAIFECHPETIRRSIEKGCISPPMELPNGKFWTVGFLLDHIEAGLTKNLREQEKENKRIAKLPV